LRVAVEPVTCSWGLALAEKRRIHRIAVDLSEADMERKGDAVGEPRRELRSHRIDIRNKSCGEGIDRLIKRNTLMRMASPILWR
jgi:hypothetical protein